MISREGFTLEPTDRQTKRYRLTIREKIVAGMTAALSGLGIGNSVTFGLYSFFTNSVNGANLGMTLAAGMLMPLLVSLGVVAAVIAAGITLKLFLDNIRQAKETNERIIHENAMQAVIVHAYEECLLDELLALIELRYRRAELDDDGFVAAVTAIHQETVQVEQIYTNKPATHPRLIQLANQFFADNHASVKRSDFEENSHHEKKAIIRSYLDNTLALRGATLYAHIGAQPTVARPKTSYIKGILTGMISCVSTFGSIYGFSQGLAALLMGSFAGLALATPVVGWCILAGAIVLGLSIGIAVGYYKHKNELRQAELDHIKEQNHELRSEIKKTELDARVIGLQSKIVKKNDKLYQVQQNQPLNSDKQVKLQRKIQALQHDKSELTNRLLMFAPAAQDAHEHHAMMEAEQDNAKKMR